MGRANRRRASPEQSRQRRWRRIRRWLIGPLQLSLLAAVGVVLGVCAYHVAAFLKTSSALSVRRIEVNGTSRTRMEDLLRLAGLREGVNVFSIDLQWIEARLTGDPWVRRARVRRVVPDRIVLEIEEQQPTALASLEGLYLVNPQGEVFKRLQPAEPIDLPIITGIDRASFSEQPEASAERIRSALALIDRVEHTACLTGRDLAEVHLDELLGTTLVLDPGALSVRLGEDASPARLRLLCRLLAELGRRRMVAHTILLDHAGRKGWATVRLEHRRTGASSDRAKDS